MYENYFLKTENAARLYREAAEKLPIIDFHNHVSVADIAANRQYENLYELWLAPDPYKHRLMRICGIGEHYITGDADPYEKFERFCTLFPMLAGNPVYDWSRMELSGIFGIPEIPCRENAGRIWAETNEKLHSSDFSTKGILSRFSIEYQSPVASLTDDLSCFSDPGTAPSLRGDNLLSPDKNLLETLKSRTGCNITDLHSYIGAVSQLMDRFSAAGCCFADHALDDGFFAADTDGRKREILTLLAGEYARRGWTLLLHLDARRNTSTRLAQLAGPAGGYAAVGGRFDLSALCGLLGNMERKCGLPDTVLFPLNINDQAPLAVLQGSFSEDGTASKVQLGPAWWWCDHAQGIQNTLSSIASFGLVSQFIGMTTDSRSILSFVRHDYFRRLLCVWIDEQNTAGEWNLPFAIQAEIVRKICYQNIKDKIQKVKTHGENI